MFVCWQLQDDDCRQRARVRRPRQDCAAHEDPPPAGRDARPQPGRDVGRNQPALNHDQKQTGEFI